MEWNAIEDSELNERTIYTGAFGWRDNDAIGHIWTRTPKQFEAAIRKAMRDEARSVWISSDTNETLTDLVDQIWYVGPFAQTVGETIESLEEKDRADEMRDDIRTSNSGYVY